MSVNVKGANAHRMVGVQRSSTRLRFRSHQAITRQARLRWRGKTRHAILRRATGRSDALTLLASARYSQRCETSFHLVEQQNQSNASAVMTSVDKAFEVCEVLSGSPRGMSLSELARALRQPPPTVHRL